MITDWQLQIRKDVISDQVILRFRRKHFEKTQFLDSLGRICEVDPGTLIPTNANFLTMDPETFEVFRRDINKQLDQMGTPSPVTAEIEGELRATKTHLEDMRKIVFKGFPK